jgi:DHA1 family bicyclomycin/chloramphenicol resistance-like MFS transporter
MIKFTSWHSIFWLLVVIGILMFASLWWLPETLAEEKRVKASVKGAFKNYAALLRNRKFMQFTLSLTSYYVAAYAFITGSPFVYIRYFGVAPQYYGWLFAVNIVGVMGMSFVNRRLVNRYSLEILLKYASSVAALAAVAMAASVWFHVGGIALIVVLIFIFFSMNGIIAASSTAAALDAVPGNAGSASALIGSLQYGSGIVSSLLLATLSDGTPWTMAWIIALFATLAMLLAQKK